MGCVRVRVLTWGPAVRAAAHRALDACVRRSACLCTAASCAPSTNAVLAAGIPLMLTVHCLCPMALGRRATRPLAGNGRHSASRATARRTPAETGGEPTKLSTLAPKCVVRQRAERSEMRLLLLALLRARQRAL